MSKHDCGSRSRLHLAPLSGVAAGLGLGGVLLAFVATSGQAVEPSPTGRSRVDLAAVCQPAAVEAVASTLADGLTVKPVSDGMTKLPGGVKFVPAANRLPAYCQVTGSFVTNPATGKTANFLATFPANWNGKYLQYGCFGHCGGLILNDAANPLVTIISQGYPGDALRKGYASFGTDEGHSGASWGAWAVKGPGEVDEDAITDFLYRANKVLARTGKAFTRAFYGRALGAPQKISYAYFAGCSGGGRDALVAASYFPEEFDGIIAGSPYANMVGVGIQGTGVGLAATRSAAAQLPPELVARIDPIVKAQCDALDGVKDGLIQNPAACNFRPERDLPKCAGDKPDQQCFTKAQIQTISTVLTAVTDENGKVVQPGYTASELQAAFQPPLPKDPNAAVPWDDSGNSGPGGMAMSGFGSLKVLVHKNDPDFDVRRLFSFEGGGAGPVTDFRIVVPRAEVDRAMAALRMGIGSAPANYDRLIQQNRKLLIWHNLSDQFLTPYMSFNLYKQLAARHGGYAKLQDDVRLFSLPGTVHCNAGGTGPGSFDALTAMENWVERRQAPDALIARAYPSKVYTVDFSKPSTRSMPLCKFPEMARYNGRGDVNDAANWTCPAGDTRMLRVGESGRQAGVITSSPAGSARRR
jgi:feruloyl esterase